MTVVRGREFATLEWVDWFNNRRLLEPTSNIPTAEVAERYYALLDEQKLAARLRPNSLRQTWGGSQLGTANERRDLDRLTSIPSNWHGVCGRFGA